MQSSWYRLPDDDESRVDAQVPQRARGRGRGAGRGRGRGRGSAHQAPEPYGDATGATAPYSTHAMGWDPYMQAAHAHPYYHAAGMDAMQQPWYHAAHHAQPPYRPPHYPAPHAPCYARYPPRHYPPPNHLPHHHHVAAAHRDHLQQYMNMGPAHVPHPATTNRGRHASSPGFHHLPYMYPAYVSTENNTSQKAYHQQAEIPSVQKVEQQRTRQIPTTQSQVSQELAVVNHANRERPSRTTKRQKENDINMHLAQTPEFFNELNAAVVPQKTLAETAAFLNDPQISHQQIKKSERSKPLSKSSIDQLDNNKIIFLDSPEPSEPQEVSCFNKPILPLLTGKEIQLYKRNRATKPTYDNPIIPASIPDFRKYSELSVTVGKEPPPAHQAVIQTYPDLYTPPLAHQAPVTHMPTRPQSARTHAIPLPSPPQAHQASVPQSHVKELLAICRQQTERPTDEQTVLQSKSKKVALSQRSSVMTTESVTNARPKRQPNKRKTNAPQTNEDIIRAAHAVYDPDKLVGEAQITYQPSTETYASEQVLYQPKTDMFTKEQIVYQPRTNMIAKTQVVYQPRTEFIAAAEAVYKSDGVAARQMVIQPQAGVMKTAEAVYQTQENILKARQTIYQSSKDKSESNQQGSGGQTRTQSQTRTARGGNQTRTSQPEKQATKNEEHDEHALDRASSILRNVLSNELAQNEPQASERNFPTLQQYIQENRTQIIQNHSNHETSNQRLRQARKRKITPSQPDETQLPRQLSEAEIAHLLAVAGNLPAGARSAPSLNSLNWAHSMSINYQVMLGIITNIIASNNQQPT